MRPVWTSDSGRVHPESVMVCDSCVRAVGLDCVSRTVFPQGLRFLALKIQCVSGAKFGGGLCLTPPSVHIGPTATARTTQCGLVLVALGAPVR